MKKSFKIGLAGLLFTSSLAMTADRNSSARPYQVAVGVIEKESATERTLVLNLKPCGGASRFVTFKDKFVMKPLGTRTCNATGNSYQATQVTQCGGDHDETDNICKFAH